MKKDFIPGKHYQKLTKSASSLKRVKEIASGDWELIKSFFLEPDAFNQDEIQAFTLNLANNQIDRDQERFSEEVLKSFAKTLPGKSLLIGHQWGPPGKGTFFKAVLKTEDSVTWLKASFYVLKSSSQSMIDNIMAGIWKFVSIGFSAPAIVRIPADDDQSKTMYWEYRNKDGQEAEALEGSFVWLGAQYDAEAVKKALGGELGNDIKKYVQNLLDNNPPEEEIYPMKLKLKHLDINEEIKTDADLDAAADMIDEEIAKIKGESILDAEFFSGVKKLFPEDEEPTVAAIKTMKETAEAFRKTLVDDIIKFGTLIKMIKDDEQEIDNERKFYSDLPVERLQKQLDTYRAKYAEMNPGYSELNSALEDKGQQDSDMVDIPGTEEY